MTTAVLALQGAFAEHRRMLAELGEQTVELRQAEDLRRDFDRLVLPGGESTVQGKLLRELGMLESLRERVEAGMPVLGTCAGLILMAARIEGGQREAGTARGGGAGTRDAGAPILGSLPVAVRRNAYGRQLASFHSTATFADLGQVPMTFIRAPQIVDVGEGVEVLAEVDDVVVAVRYGSQVATAFHPELDGDTRIHEMFLGLS